VPEEATDTQAVLLEESRHAARLQWDMFDRLANRASLSIWIAVTAFGVMFAIGHQFVAAGGLAIWSSVASLTLALIFALVALLFDNYALVRSTSPEDATKPAVKLRSELLTEYANCFEENSSRLRSLNLLISLSFVALVGGVALFAVSAAS
jgi:hypothetical protein